MANALSNLGSGVDINKALSSGGLGSVVKPTTGLISGGQSMAVPQTQPKPVAIPVGSNSGLLQSKPSTPVKSVSTTQPDGSQQTTTYHAPGTDATGKNLAGTGGSTGAGMITTPPPQTGNNTGMISSPYTGTTPAPGYNSDGTNKTVPIDFSQTNNANPGGLPGTQPIPTPTPYTPNTTQGQYISDLASRSQQPIANYQQIQDLLAENARKQNDLNNAVAEKNQQIGSSGVDLSLATGEKGLLNQLNSQKLSGLQQEANQLSQMLSSANTQQNLQQGALSSAIGANAPQFPSYSQQVYSPSQGFVGGGSGGQLPQSAVDYVNSLAQQVKNGQMTRSDAESRLSQYSQLGLQALNTALGSNFNTNASNASAGTTAVGQQVKTAADSTNKALDTLSGLFTNLPGWNTGGIPSTNSLSNWISTQLGSQALTAYETNLADARSQLIGVLNSSGGTPTGNEATAKLYLPENMTKQQFDQNVGTVQNPGIVRQLIQQKVGSFTGSGSQNPTTQTSTPTTSSGYKNGGAF